MTVLFRKPWEYTLYRDGDRHFFSVLCGSVALYEVVVELTKEELSAWLSDGEIALDHLGSRIRNSPGAFKARAIVDFHPEEEE